VPARDAEHGAALAVGTAAARARRAAAAHGVDLAHHAPADERLGAPLDDADELVAQDPGARVVAAGDLEVGVADAGADHADQRLAGRR